LLPGIDWILSILSLFEEPPLTGKFTNKII
jgi:hypothetical protein